MKYKKLVFLVLALMLVAVALPASAAPNTKLDLFQDCSVGCPEAVDMTGPTGFGLVNYNYDSNGKLRLVVSLKNAEPNTSYAGVFYVCGPTHASACGFQNVGSLTTNGQGNATGNFTVEVPDQYLVNSHLDILKGVGDTSAGVYAATFIAPN